MKIRAKYNLNKTAKVGQELVCPSCGTIFIKTCYQQAFCKSKAGTQCKDKFWNTVTPNKRNNKTRISPANKAWQIMQNSTYGSKSVYDSFHPFEGLNDDEYKSF